jgi:hypothetical protein
VGFAPMRMPSPSSHSLRSSTVAPSGAIVAICVRSIAGGAERYTEMACQWIAAVVALDQDSFSDVPQQVGVDVGGFHARDFDVAMVCSNLCAASTLASECKTEVSLSWPRLLFAPFSLNVVLALGHRPHLIVNTIGLKR